MADTVPYRPRQGEIPTDPGVYRFRNARGRVLYVGKASNLRARLSNYFAPLASLHERTRRMVLTATSVDWTVVRTDNEALQLEFTWIKEFDPPFNVRFKDDKTYPYLAVTLGEEAPRAVITRKRDIRGARYFGPYPKVWAVRETVELMQRAIPIRTCNDADYKRAMQTGKPCLAGQIGRCGGPCSQRIGIAEHRIQVERFVDFLSGRDRSVLSELEGQMHAAAADQQYELAGRIRDRMVVLREVLTKSAVVLAEGLDTDALGVVDDELAAAVQLFIIRGGRIRGTRSWTVDKELALTRPELIERAVQEIYDDLEPPREILVPELPEDAAELEAWLSERRQDGRSVALRIPQRGEKAALVQNAERNAGENLARYKLKRSADFTARSIALTDLQEALDLPEAPLRIECYDVSHLSGTNIVASMVVFEDGAPRKDQYRRFSIAESTDDTESLRQVLRRRLSYLQPKRAVAETGDPDSAAAVESAGTDDSAAAGGGASAAGAPTDREPLSTTRSGAPKFSYPPQLLLIDGGQPQVASVQSVLEESGVPGIRVVGIAKRLEELWLPGEEFPVILPRGSEALFLVQRLRDEAHRFAITHQRQRRKRDITSVLSELPGLGPTRVARLLKHFGSVTALRRAELEEIAAVDGIGPRLAGAIYQELSGSPTDVQPDDR